MKVSTLKKIIFVFALLIGLIVVAQLFWLNKLYSFEERQFTTNVFKSVRGLFEDLDLVSEQVVHLQQFVERPDANTFLVRIEKIPDKDSLSYYLQAELEDFDVFTECNVAVYDQLQHAYVYSQSIPLAASHNLPGTGISQEKFDRNFNYVLLNFPRRKEFILHSMEWWIFFAVFLFLAICGLAASLVYLYRQKFLNEIQSDFIRNVTHEFQTPLTTLTLGLDMLSKQGIKEQPDKVERYTSVMLAQADYLKQHMENLVKVIQTDAYGIELKKEPVTPSHLVRNAIHQLEFMITEKSAKVEVCVDKNEKTIMADRPHLYLAILNVISNALKFSRQPVVHIDTSADEKYYSICVKDNGIGIEKKYLRLLFKKFYRVPKGDVHDVKGLGLGLYFVKKIISLHRGRIEVKSTPGAGTEFKMLLPVN